MPTKKAALSRLHSIGCVQGQWFKAEAMKQLPGGYSRHDERSSQDRVPGHQLIKISLRDSAWGATGVEAAGPLGFEAAIIQQTGGSGGGTKPVLSGLASVCLPVFVTKRRRTESLLEG